MKHTISRYGLIGGGAMVALFLLSTLILGKRPDNMTVAETVGYVTMILCLLSIYFGIRKVRDTDGHIGFLRGFLSGLGIAFIASIMFGGYSFWLFKYGDPEFSRDYHQHQIEQIKSSDLPPEEIARRVQELENMPEVFFNAGFQSFVMFATVLVLGIVIALFSALALRGASPSREAAT